MGCVIVAEGTLGQGPAPCELGTAEHSAKEPGIQRVEDLFEVVVVPLRARVAFAAARVANQFRLAGNGSARCETLKTKSAATKLESSITRTGAE